MLIDWFTVAAQIVNFLILLALLKYFLFDRIQNAMRDRENKIEEKFDEARKEKEVAEKERSEYREMKNELEDMRSEKIKEAENEAEKRRDELMEKARKESESLRENWKDSLRREKESFYRQFQEKAIEQIFSTAKKALSTLADTDLQKKVLDTFLERFEDVPDEQLPLNNENAIMIKTGIELTDKEKEKIKDSIDRRLPDFPGMEFKKEPGLIFGFELLAGDKKMAWHPKEYIQSLEKRIKKALVGATDE